MILNLVENYMLKFWNVKKRTFPLGKVRKDLSFIFDEIMGNMGVCGSS